MGGRLEGRICLVTGGCRGFGASIVSLFVWQGARCLVLDLNLPEPEQLNGSQGFYNPYMVTQPPCDSGSGTGTGTSCSIQEGEKKAYVIQADITQKETWQTALETCDKVFGQLPTVVVNNAGWTYSNKPTLEVNEDEYDRVFNVNVKPIFLSVNTLIPKLIQKYQNQNQNQNQDAVWINISSTSAIRPRPGLVWYCASKGAVSTATKALAIEYAPYKIRFNTVCPVAGNTPLLSKFAGSKEAGDPMTTDQLAQFHASVPLARLAEPCDIANACLFLADPNSAFITGIDLPVDGGRCI